MVSPDTRGIWVEWTGKQKKRKGAKGEQGNEEAIETSESELWSFRRAHRCGMRRRVSLDVLELQHNIYHTAFRLAANLPVQSKRPRRDGRRGGKEAGEPEADAYPSRGAEDLAS